jgi:hypothetical protein
MDLVMAGCTLDGCDLSLGFLKTIEPRRSGMPLRLGTNPVRDRHSRYHRRPTVRTRAHNPMFVQTRSELRVCALATTSNATELTARNHALFISIIGDLVSPCQRSRHAFLAPREGPSGPRAACIKR